MLHGVIAFADREREVAHRYIAHQVNEGVALRAVRPGVWVHVSPIGSRLASRLEGHEMLDLRPSEEACATRRRLSLRLSVRNAGFEVEMTASGSGDA